MRPCFVALASQTTARQCSCRSSRSHRVSCLLARCENSGSKDLGLRKKNDLDGRKKSTHGLGLGRNGSDAEVVSVIRLTHQ